MLNNKVIAKEYVEKNYISKELIKNKINELWFKLEHSDDFIEDKIILNQLHLLKDLLDEGETNDGDKTR